MMVCPLTTQSGHELNEKRYQRTAQVKYSVYSPVRRVIRLDSKKPRTDDGRAGRAAHLP